MQNTPVRIFSPKKAERHLYVISKGAVSICEFVSRIMSAADEWTTPRSSEPIGTHSPSYLYTRQEEPIYEEEVILISDERATKKHQKRQQAIESGRRLSKEALEHGKKALKFGKKKGAAAAEFVGDKASEVRDDIAVLGVLEYGRQVGGKALEKGSEGLEKGKEIGEKVLENASPVLQHAFEEAKAKGSRVISMVNRRVCTICCQSHFLGP